MHWERSFDEASVIPNSLESRFPPEGNKFRRAIAAIDFKESQEKKIGGHAFPRRSATRHHSVVPTVVFDPQRTKIIINNCKSHNVSVAAALFSVCNISWAGLTPDKPEFPVMMSSALNLRPHLNATQGNDSYWFLACGKFHIILPSFVSKHVNISSTFWKHAQSAEEQITRAGKSLMVISRSRLMARERSQRSRTLAMEDDNKKQGTWVTPTINDHFQPRAKRAPSTTLIGLSLMGNLDGIYQHAKYPNIELLTLMIGARQRLGGIFLFAYTFRGQLWINLEYEKNGFDQDVVQKFWCNCLSAIDNFLCARPEALPKRHIAKL